MPTYQYRCTECDHAFEEFQSFTDEALTVCPVCGGRLRKVFNAVGVVFKGSGFYRNDSRSKTGSAAGGPTSSSPNGSDSSTGSSGSSSSSSTSDSSGSSSSSDTSGKSSPAKPSSSPAGSSSAS